MSASDKQEHQILEESLRKLHLKILECLETATNNEKQFKLIKQQYMPEIHENLDLSKICYAICEILVSKIKEQQKESSKQEMETSQSAIHREEYQKLEDLLQKSEADNRNYLKYQLQSKLQMEHLQAKVEEFQKEKEETFNSTKQHLTQKNKEILSLHNDIAGLKDEFQGQLEEKSKQINSLKLKCKQLSQLLEQQEQSAVRNSSSGSNTNNNTINNSNNNSTTLRNKSGSGNGGSYKAMNISLHLKKTLNTELKHSSDPDLIKHTHFIPPNNSTISTLCTNPATATHNNINLNSNNENNFHGNHRKPNENQLISGTQNSNSLHRSNDNGFDKAEALLLRNSGSSNQNSNINNLLNNYNKSGNTPSKNEQKKPLNSSIIHQQNMLSNTSRLHNNNTSLHTMNNSHNVSQLNNSKAYSSLGQFSEENPRILSNSKQQKQQQQQQQQSSEPSIKQMLIRQIKDVNKESLNKSTQRLEHKELSAYLNRGEVFSANNSVNTSFKGGVGGLRQHKRSKSQQGNRIKGGVVNSSINSSVGRASSSLNHRSRQLNSSLSQHNSSVDHSTSFLQVLNRESYLDLNYPHRNKAISGSHPNNLSFSQQQMLQSVYGPTHQQTSVTQRGSVYNNSSGKRAPTRSSYHK